MALSDYVTLHEPQSASSPPLSASHAAASPPPSVRTRHVPSPAGVRKGVDSVRFTTAAEPPTVGASVSVPLSGTAHLDDSRAQGEAVRRAGRRAGARRMRRGRVRCGRRDQAPRSRGATAAVPGGAAPTSGGKGSDPEPQPWVRHLHGPPPRGGRPELSRAIAGLRLGGHAAAPWRGGVGRVSRVV